MQAFVTVFLSGIGLGCVYGLLALSYNVLYRASGVFSFAQGQLLALGALGAYELTVAHKLPLILAFIITAVFVSAVNIVIERVAVTPVLRARMPLWVLSTLGAGLLITAIAQRVWGTVALRVPAYFSPQNLSLDGVTVTTGYVLPLIAVIAITLGLWQMEKRSRLGKAIRALALNRSAAIMAGVPPSRYSMIAFGIGGSVAGLAGFLTAPTLSADPNSGFAVGVVAFAAWAIGGFGSNFGAALGGLVVGVAEQVASFYWNSAVPLISIFAALLVVMLVRPSGLFGKLAVRQV